MKLIIISGPSGSGKTTLSKIILNKFKDGIILNTDNYYKTGIISKILSNIVDSYFDRIVSFNHRLFKRDLEFILKNGFSNYCYDYNFERKSIKKINKRTNDIRFVIVEGIFGQEVIRYLSDDNYVLINLITNKESCMQRVIKRDFVERGKSENLAKKDFIKAWKLFFKNKKKKKSINYSSKIFIQNQSDINLFLEKLTKIVN